MPGILDPNALTVSDENGQPMTIAGAAPLLAATSNAPAPAQPADPSSPSLWNKLVEYNNRASGVINGLAGPLGGAALDTNNALSDAVRNPSHAWDAAKKVGGAALDANNAFGAALRAGAGSAPFAAPQAAPQSPGDMAPERAPAPASFVMPKSFQPAPGQAKGTGGSGAAPGQQSADDKKLADIQSERMAAAQESAKVGVAKAAEEYGYKQESLKQDSALVAQAAQRNAAYQASFSSQMKSLESAQAAMAAGPDPGRYWGSRSTGEKVLAGIGLALGAFGAQATGGVNVAASMIQKSIDDDIDRQRKSLEAGVSGRLTLLGQMREHYQDTVQADAATRALLLDHATRQIDTVGAKYGAPDIQAKLGELKAQIGAEGQKALQDFRTQATTNAHTRAQTTLAYAEADKARAEAGAKGVGRPLEAGEATKVGDYDAAISALGRLWASYQKRAKAPLSGIMSKVPGVQTDAKEYEGQRGAAAEVFGRSMTDGKRTGPEAREAFLDQLPSAQDTNERAKEKLQNAYALIRSKRAAAIRALSGAGFSTTGLAAAGTEPTAPGSFRPSAGEK